MRERGHEIVSYRSAGELIVDDRCAAPDLIIIDGAQGEVEALESRVRLRRHPRFTDSPVLMPTSQDNEEAITHAYAAGATDVFIKSPHWTLLAERIKHLCRTAVVRAIVALGRSLRLQVVAEGVEMAVQLRALLDMDCRCMQGYRFSRAVHAEEIGRAIERIRAQYSIVPGIMKPQGLAPVGAAAWSGILQ